MRFCKTLYPLVFITAASFLPAEEPKQQDKPQKGYTFKQAKDLIKFLMKPTTLKAQRTHTKVAMAELVRACEDFYDEYQQLPLGSKAITDEKRLTTGGKGMTLMNALVGLEAAKEENYKHINFFSFKTAKEKKGGVLRTKTAAQLFDPWGNPYHVLLDYDYDKRLREPLGIGNEVYFDTKVLVWSPGPDGKHGTPETNKDNLYSWNKSSPK